MLSLLLKLIKQLPACSLALLPFDTAHGVVVPPPTEFAEGNSFLDLPFGPESRFQQVYAANYIALITLNNPTWLDRISFRVDGRGRSFQETLSSVQINFSTTPFGPDQLSPVFAKNVGPDDQVCRSGPLSIMGTDGGGDGPNFFNIEINLTTPFFYDPRQGNLLMDIRNFSGRLTSSFDAHTILGDTVSSVWAIGVNSSMGTAGTIGLVTDFHFLPVPEPSAWALFGLGLTAWLFFLHCNRNHQGDRHGTH